MIPKLHLTISSEKFILFLLNQQFYCWGKDILSSQGNFLIEENFERTRAPEGAATGSSAYEKISGDVYLCLFGFGLFCGRRENGGIFLNRNKLPPLITSLWKQPEPHWVDGKKSSLSCPRTEKEKRAMYSLLGSVFMWISGYEERVLEKRGEEYRHKLLVERNLRLLSVPLVPSVWSELAFACSANSPYDAFRLITKKYKPQIHKPSCEQAISRIENKVTIQTMAR